MKALAGFADLVGNHSTVWQAVEFSTEDGFSSLSWFAFTRQVPARGQRHPPGLLWSLPFSFGNVTLRCRGLYPDLRQTVTTTMASRLFFQAPVNNSSRVGDHSSQARVQGPIEFFAKRYDRSSLTEQPISELDCLRGEKQLWLAGADGKASAKNQEDGWVDSFCGT